MNLIAYWLVFAMFGVTFLAIMTKLAFDPKFRHDMMAQPGRAKIGPLSVQGATILVLIICVGGALVFLAKKLAETPVVHIEETPQSEQVIRDYFNSINEGIAGNSKGYEQAWSLLSETYQNQKRQRYPSYKFPDEYGRLYVNSAHHKLVLCTRVGGNAEDGDVVYYTVLKLTEPHFTNPFFEFFSPSTKKQVMLLNNLLAPANISDVLFKELEAHYVVPSDFSKDLFSNRVSQVYLNRLISPRLLTELAADFKLDKRPIPQFTPIGLGIDVYEVYEGDKIRVTRVGSKWRINGFIISTFCGHRFDN